MMCMECGEYETVTKETAKTEMEINDLLREGERLLAVSGREKSALDKLLKSWKLGRKIFYKHNSRLNLAADLVAKCLTVLEDYRRSVMFLKCTVLAVEAKFGSTSIETAAELKKLADVIRIYVTSNKFKEVNSADDSR